MDREAYAAHMGETQHRHFTELNGRISITWSEVLRRGYSPQKYKSSRTRPSDFTSHNSWMGKSLRFLILHLLSTFSLLTTNKNGQSKFKLHFNQIVFVVVIEFVYNLDIIPHQTVGFANIFSHSIECIFDVQ